MTWPHNQAVLLYLDEGGMRLVLGVKVERAGEALGRRPEGCACRCGGVLGEGEDQLQGEGGGQPGEGARREYKLQGKEGRGRGRRGKDVSYRLSRGGWKGEWVVASSGKVNTSCRGRGK